MPRQTPAPLLVLVPVLVLSALAQPGAADIQAATGRVLALLVNEPGSDIYLQYHGQIAVGDSISGVATYNWGGSRCPGLGLPEGSVASLQRALDNPRIVVQPFIKIGQGGHLCIVAVRYILRNEQGLFP
jgi:hypothetical protein